MPNYVAEINRDKLLIKLKRFTVFKDGCWLYTIGIESNGYARITINKVRVQVIRASCFIFKNMNLDNCELQANHTDECKNRNCWNPDHLYVGTHSDNMKDSVRVNTHKESRKTHCPKGHLLDGKRKNGVRYCLECNRIRVKAYFKGKNNA